MVRTKHLPGRPSVDKTTSLLIALLGNVPSRGLRVSEWLESRDGQVGLELLNLAPPRGCVCQNCFLTQRFLPHFESLQHLY